MEKLFTHAGGAGEVDAAPVDFAFGLDELACADRTLRGEDDLFGAAWVLVVADDLGDFGDHIAAAFDRDEVADADA